MTYSLDTLNSRNSPAVGAPSGFKRFTREAGLIFGLVGLLFWLAALLSYSPQDAAWSTSGSPEVASGVLVAAKNWGGHLGAWVADASYFLFGFSVWWALAAGCRAWLISLTRGLRDDKQISLQSRRASRIRFWLSLLVLLVASAALEWSRLYRFEFRLPDHAGGVIGYFLGNLSVKWLGFAGSGLIFIALGVIAVASVFNFSWAHVALSLGGRIDRLMISLRAKRELAADLAVGKKAAREREETLIDERIEIEEHHPVPIIIKPPLEALTKAERSVKIRPQAPTASARPGAATTAPSAASASRSKLPQVGLLDTALQRQESVASETLEMTSRLIEKKLKDFGVEVRVVAAAPGPVITRYEIEPATGVKGSQVVTLAKDLARALSLVSIRVIETIPGKNYMALELPNAKRQMIKLSEILGSQVYHDATSLLTMGLGKDIAGNAVVADLAKMPHCLVAGTTGSGKSVGINAMILSLLFKADPRDVRLLLIDPKMLEMSVYEGIPHLLAPVVTDMRQAAHGLNWCVAEMEKRYKLMSKLGVRNLAGYNAKIDEANANGKFIYNPFSLTPDEPEPLQRLPYIVVVIDELADLMMVVGKKIEELIARLAQKARAAGIHLILATQRPSVDVITGLIKANIPTRLSFQVSSKIDSRTILDQMGAEALLGMGDMLYMPSGTGFPIRVHGAFVSDDEVHRVVAYLKQQGEPNYIDGVLEGGTVDGEGGDLSGDAGGEKDPMYDQAVEVVLKNRKASISLVQRHLKIGYNRAARLVEEMENAGLVSAMSGSGQREILVPTRAE
ncbi:S-DNA-T family DNA segregation ATPase FtsK/SpoIIIE [Polaromonas sp. CG_9.5]|uniref:DNA translocase FtsK n=1 Tax=Polaromonas sp. CG_9.5 TaxID=3071705 RepID=UPI002E038DC4|nr:S-DNA-T family DNA segregation ATPase FtsK/SpoIIIE [Polaromonas sp. CG_9.5]